jgi:hypothetical protein
MDIFTTLGARIEEAWQRADFDELALPALASAALREARLHEQIGLDDVLRWVLEAPTLPHQEDIQATFGEPPVTVYHGRRLHIQVLYWLTATTSIHRHGFTGAFLVLHGSSLHSRFSFRRRRRVSSRMAVGDLHIRSTDLLEKGDVVEIERDLTHSLFHLEAPSATVVVRSLGEDEAGPQYSYLPPSLAIDPFYREPTTERRMQALGLLLRSKHADYDTLAAGLAARSDLHTVYLVLEQAYRQLGDRARVSRLVEAAQERHGPVIGEIIASIEEALRRSKISRLRRSVRDPEHRYFLALVQNLPDRGAIYAMVRQRYPVGDPRDRVVAWARDLSGVDKIGIDFDDPLNQCLFAALVDSRSDDEVMEKLEAEFGAAQVSAQAAALAEHRERMRRTALAPLFYAGASG